IEYSVFLDVNELADEKVVSDSVEEIITMAMNSNLEIFLVSNNPDSLNINCLLPSKVHSRNNRPMLFHQALSLAKGRMAALLSPGWNLPICWPKWLQNHFSWHDDVGLVKMLGDPDTARAQIEAILPGAEVPLRQEVLSSALLYMAIGKSSVNDNLKAPCAMIPLPVLRACVQAFPALFQGDVIANLENLVTSMGLNCLTALESYAYPLGEEFIIWDEEALMKIVSILKKERRMQEAVDLIKEHKS
ncbi:MAG: hypothetical protein R6X11_11855, partial [Desulfonatronovibrio sp.]